ncbi:MAG: aminotransferase class I/II-fold pyridoxal phosphate-dependent enzyme, partial [Spirochaetaceae bacterium]|nr:aminotransferase class I/II-fold pyridoxal phosphate-dependent enzyme [Spirochaetaceae bacterium]
MEIDYIPFARPHVGKDEEEAVLRILRSGWLTTGTEALAFEKEFAAFLDNPDPETQPSDSTAAPAPPPLQALAVNSATSGLHLALEACGIGPGDSVLLPSYTFTATAEAARYLGAEPVFVDVSPGSFHLDPDALEKTLSRLDAGLPAYPQRGGFGPRGKATAVIPVHYGGLPCDMERILEMTRRRG